MTKYQREDIEELKRRNPCHEILAEDGYHPVRARGAKLEYKSPLREESSASNIPTASRRRISSFSVCVIWKVLMQVRLGSAMVCPRPPCAHACNASSSARVSSNASSIQTINDKLSELSQEIGDVEGKQQSNTAKVNARIDQLEARLNSGG